MHTGQVIVVGAGISGVTLARGLREAGIAVTVLEKSRGFGGRMATRRWDAQRFDHGAQSFSLRTRQARKVIQPLIEQGVVKRWPGGEPWRHDEERWIGRPGMSSIARALADGIRVMNGAHVAKARPIDAGWTVRLKDGIEAHGRILALTSPVPQSLEILGSAADALEPALKIRLKSINYDSCFALLARLPQPARGAWRSGLQFDDERIAWIADNQTKLRPGESGNGSLVALSTPGFARRYEHAERELVAEAMTESVEALVGMRIKDRRLHWWKYASPASRITEPAAASTEPAPVLFCGDAFGEGMVEGAISSGAAGCKLAVEMLACTAG